jgi:hypothetical protein
MTIHWGVITANDVAKELLKCIVGLIARTELQKCVMNITVHSYKSATSP